MKDYNADNTVPFQKRKNSDNTKNTKKTVTKSEKVVSLSSYKKEKSKKNRPSLSKLFDRQKLKKNYFPIILVAVIVIIVLSTIFGESLSVNSTTGYSPSKMENSLNIVEKPVYKVIVAKTVASYIGEKYDVEIYDLHKNGNYIYSQGYIDVPNQGKVYYDLILDDTEPLSLRINGQELVK